MRIVRQTPTVIVVQDSSLWIAVICGLGFLLIAFLTAHAGNLKGVLCSPLLLIFALAWLRLSTFTFDAGAQMIRWRRLRVFRIASGAIPFGAVQDIRLEESSSDKANVMIYRLTIATAGGDVPMSDVYSGSRDHFDRLRQTLLAFVGGETLAAAGPGAFADNPDAARAAEFSVKIRSLLREGRNIDAILLMQRTEHLDLTEATFRVNQIERLMKSEGVGRR